MSPKVTKTQRIFCFIDAENVRNAMEDYGFADLDYSKVYGWMTKKRGVSRIYLYAAIEQGDLQKEQKYQSMADIGYYISLKRVMSYKQRPWLLDTRCPKCHHRFIRTTYIKDKKKANCDAEMTLDIVRFGVRKKYDEIIVFSGDGDFARVYEYVARELKKKISLYAPMNYRTARNLKELGKNHIISLNDLKQLCLHYSEAKINP
jgi:uncharacterized LabA/DUF88 family protein